MDTTLREGDVIRYAASKETTWRIKAVCFDGTLLVEPVILSRYRSKDNWRIITRPEGFQRIETSVGGTSGDCRSL